MFTVSRICQLDWPEIHQLQKTGTLEENFYTNTQEELGEIKGIKGKISIDPQAQPRFCKLRLCHLPQEKGGKEVGATREGGDY